MEIAVEHPDHGMLLYLVCKKVILRALSMFVGSYPLKEGREGATAATTFVPGWLADKAGC